MRGDSDRVGGVPFFPSTSIQTPFLLPSEDGSAKGMTNNHITVQRAQNIVIGPRLVMEVTPLGHEL
jgi:hypothetical protein